MYISCIKKTITCIKNRKTRKTTRIKIVKCNLLISLQTQMISPNSYVAVYIFTYFFQTVIKFSYQLFLHMFDFSYNINATDGFFSKGCNQIADNEGNADL